MAPKTLTEHALWLDSLGYLAQPDEPRDAVIVLTENGPQFVTRAFLDDGPVAETITRIMPPPSLERIAEDRAVNVAALRAALDRE